MKQPEIYRYNWIKRTVEAVLLLTPLVATAEKEFMDDWYIFGSNTVRGSVYDTHGSGAGSPYPFEGGMLFDEFNVYMSKQNSQYDLWRGEVSGVVNLDDRYRSVNNGLVPERLNFTRENGESGLPYRFEAGDYFSYYSYLTLQRSLKGAQLELQPFSGSPGLHHSIVLTMGADESNWRDFNLEDNFVSGASWLIQDENEGALSFNFVHNFRDNNNILGTLDRNQYVMSMAGEKPYSWFGQELLLEGEIAHFGGDHNGIAGAASGQDRSENGYFMQLSGHSRIHPLDYRLRFDHYGQDFQPQGAIVTPDRRSIEAHSGWRFDSGIRMRVRAQIFEDNFETMNKLRTKTYGANFSGPILAHFYQDITGNVDAYIQHQDDELKTVNTLSQIVNLNLNKPLPNDWNGRLGVFIQNVDDSAAANADIFVRQVNVSADHAINIAGFDGYITPGVLLRTVRHGGNDSTDWGPSLAFRVRRDAHEIGVDYGGLMQNRMISIGAADINTHTLNLDYRYTRSQHIFGVEANLFGRDPQPGESTEAYRISAYWTYNFDRPPVAAAAIGTSALAPAEADASVAGLAPGFTEDQTLAALSREGVSGGSEQAGFVVYEYPLLSNIFQRQRLVLEYGAGVLERSATIIDFDDIGDQNTALQTFERIRQELIKSLGNPVRTYQQGEFSANFVADINDQRLIRVTEWTTDKGTIRFGIPRRLDNQVRMEIQYARSFPPPRETLWSIEAIR